MTSRLDGTNCGRHRTKSRPCKSYVHGGRNERENRMKKGIKIGQATEHG
jgi:hypothetical protein